jgi:hypothetical protein
MGLIYAAWHRFCKVPFWYQYCQQTEWGDYRLTRCIPVSNMNSALTEQSVIKLPVLRHNVHGKHKLWLDVILKGQQQNSINVHQIIKCSTATINVLSPRNKL